MISQSVGDDSQFTPSETDNVVDGAPIPTSTSTSTPPDLPAGAGAGAGAASAAGAGAVPTPPRIGQVWTSHEDDALRLALAGFAFPSTQLPTAIEEIDREGIFEKIAAAHGRSADSVRLRSMKLLLQHISQGIWKDANEACQAFGFLISPDDLTQFQSQRSTERAARLERRRATKQDRKERKRQQQQQQQQQDQHREGREVAGETGIVVDHQSEHPSSERDGPQKMMKGLNAGPELDRIMNGLEDSMMRCVIFLRMFRDTLKDK